MRPLGRGFFEPQGARRSARVLNSFYHKRHESVFDRISQNSQRRFSTQAFTRHFRVSYKRQMGFEEIGREIVDSGYHVHKTLGPGLLESVYEACLMNELQLRGLKVENQKGLPVIFNDMKLDCGYRMDLLVEEQVVVEVKAVEALHPVHMAQILTYLRLSENRLGFLINFNTVTFKKGIKRVLNGY